MRAVQVRRMGAGAAIAAVAAAGLVVGGVSAGHAAGGKDGATITMKLMGKHAMFTGPKTVKKGAKLTIVNASDPKKIGPHTFTLVTKGNVPKTKQDMKDCMNFKSPVCQNVVAAHKANPKTGHVGKRNVNAGKKGWDKGFGKTGDSWFSDTKGEKTSRKVSAPVGTTLYYFCVVHPEMQGKIKVVK